MEYVIAAMIAAAFGSMAYYFYRKTKLMEREHAQLTGESQPAGYLESEREKVTVDNLRIGDIVSYLGSDYMDEGHLEYDEDGWTWDTFMLKDGGDVKWLSVEWDDELEVVLWTELEDFEIDAHPPETIEYQGEVFTREESGGASVTRHGQTRRRNDVRMEYFEYEGANDSLLSVEKWGSDIEVSLGQPLNPYGLDIYPGSGSSIEDF